MLFHSKIIKFAVLSSQPDCYQTVLKSKNIKTAVVSNKFDLAVKALCKKYFYELIDIAIGENEQEGIPQKPAPMSVVKIMTDLGVNTEQVIYVGDSETDIETAYNANIDCIACSWGFRDYEILKNNNPKYIINSPKELLELI